MLRWFHKDGHIIYTEQLNTPIFDDQGKLVAIEGIARDVSKQRQLEQELLLNNYLWEEAAQVGKFGVWGYDLETKKFFGSPQLFKIIELPHEDEQKGLEVLTRLYRQESLEELINLFEKSKAEGKDCSMEAEIITWTKSKKWVSISGKAIYNYGKVSKVIGVVQDITQQKQTEERLRDSRKKLRKLYQSTQGFLEAERKRISHELHDELGQLLTIINLDLSTIMKKSRSTAIRSMAEQLKYAIDSAIRIVRRVSSELHPPLLDQLGLVSAVQWLVSQLEIRTKIKIISRLPNIFEIPIEYPHSIHIYRIIQESFTNIIRHSKATEVSLDMERKENNLYLTIKDNGKGFKLDELEETVHVGLTNMYDRAEIMGGTLNIDSIPDKGTVIKLVIPM